MGTVHRGFGQLEGSFERWWSVGLGLRAPNARQDARLPAHHSGDYVDRGGFVP